MSSTTDKTFKFLKVKTGLKAGADNDPCSPVWYQGYEAGHYKGFSDGYYGDRGGNGGNQPSYGSGGGGSNDARTYWLQQRQRMLG
jgi:hypothetical protein